MRREEFGVVLRRNNSYGASSNICICRDKDGLARGEGEAFGAGSDSAVAFETDKYKEGAAVVKRALIWTAEFEEARGEVTALDKADFTVLTVFVGSAVIW